MSLTIRCSMLPGYNDCARRAASKQFGAIISAAGFELRQIKPSVGAAVGTAVHHAVEHMLRVKMATGEIGDPSAGVPSALAAFREEIAPGVEWDDTTGNMQAAEFQIARMTLAAATLAEQLIPVAVESELRAAIAPGWDLTGHTDVQTADGGVRDIKTGALPRPYAEQLGGYSLLVRSNGGDVRRLAVDYIARSRRTKPQAPVVTHEYDVSVCERAAFATINSIRRDVERFIETRDPYAFPANPSSLMCSPRYCSAFGTAFCQLHMQKEVISNDID